MTPGGSGPRIRTWYGVGGSRFRSIATRNESPTDGLRQFIVSPSENDPSTTRSGGVESDLVEAARAGDRAERREPHHDRSCEVDTVGGSERIRAVHVQAASSPAWSAIRRGSFRSPHTALTSEELPPIAASAAGANSPRRRRARRRGPRQRAPIRIRRHDGRTRPMHARCYARPTAASPPGILAPR